MSGYIKGNKGGKELKYEAEVLVQKSLTVLFERKPLNLPAFNQ